MKYLLLSFLWCAFCAIHSALISITFTSFMKKRLGSRYRWYRLFYNLLSALILFPVLLYTWSLRGEYFFRWGGGLEILRFTMIICAMVLIILSMKEYDLLLFAGLRQVVKKGDAWGAGGGGAVKDTGILGIMRHPVYTAVFLLLWAGDLNLALLIVNIILSLYLITGTILEEKKLVLEFGNAYLEYKKRVPMFIPRRRKNIPPV